MSARERALDAVFGAIVDDQGHRWGERATALQRADMESLFDASAPPSQVWLRPRGGGKSSDLALAAAATLRYLSDPSDRIYVGASDRDQAGIILDLLGGLVRRSPALRGLEVGSSTVTAPQGARLTVIPSDGAGAFGLLPTWFLLDEMFWWADTPTRRLFWNAVSSSLGKRPDARLTIISTPGDPSSWTAEVHRHALGSDRWRVSHTPGPLPWTDPGYLADEEARLLPSMFRRLHLAEWAESEEALTSADDVDVACCLGGPLDPAEGRSYVVGVDLGVVHDATGVAVAHLEGERVVVDRIARWRGSREHPVEIGEVEAWIDQARASYRGARVVLDPWQAVGLGQRLRGRGVNVREFVFSQQGTGKLAQTLFMLLRGRRIDLPRDRVLSEELRRTRLTETSPGRFRMDTPRQEGSHGDLVVAVALAAVALLERGVEGRVECVNLRDMRRDARGEVPIEHSPSGLTLRGARYQDKDPDSGRLVPPPGWIGRAR